MTTPYISFVVCARNDDYGGNFLHRFQVFLNALFAAWKAYSLDAELIIVEWNPPEGRPRLKGVVVWPQSLKPETIRIIEVPRQIHSRWPNSDKMPLFEYIAKNVGVRRARGEFVLATNPDIVFSRRFFKFLRGKSLSPACYYRVNRYDVGVHLPLTSDLVELERLCRENWFRFHCRAGSFLRGRYLAERIRGFRQRLRHPRMLLSSLVSPVLERLHPQGRVRRIRRIHSFASGDFLLMGRSMWNRLRGYPEIFTYSHIDSMMCAVAILALDQVILPFPIYHQEHSRDGCETRPLTDFQSFFAKLEADLLSNNCQVDEVLPNAPEWGLAGYQLLEDYF